MDKLKRVLDAFWNREGFWSIVGVFATVLVGRDLIVLMLTDNPAWYGAFVFFMCILGFTIESGEKVIKRYKGEL